MIAGIITSVLLCIYLFAFLKSYKKTEYIFGIALWIALVIYWTWQAIIDTSWWTRAMAGLCYVIAVLFFRYSFGKLKTLMIPTPLPDSKKVN